MEPRWATRPSRLPEPPQRGQVPGATRAGFQATKSALFQAGKAGPVHVVFCIVALLVLRVGAAPLTLSPPSVHPWGPRVAPGATRFSASPRGRGPSGLAQVLLDQAVRVDQHVPWAPVLRLRLVGGIGRGG